MEDREERSKGIEIHIDDVFVIIKPTAPFRLAKHEALRKRNRGCPGGGRVDFLVFWGWPGGCLAVLGVVG